MKPTRLTALILTVALLCPAAVSALPGSEDNPVVTLEYIEGVYLPGIKDKAVSSTNSHMNGVFAGVRSHLGGNALSEEAFVRKVMAQLNFRSNGPERLTLKSDSRLTVGLGTSFILLSGGIAHSLGTLTNLTAGRDAVSGTALAQYNEYVGVSDETTVRVTADAEILLTGTYRIVPPYTAMYKDLCDALMMMEIINTYELERNTTRMEMFIIFVTILGVKDEASVYQGTHPFTDATWGQEYVAYLYANNHTAGTGNNRFSPNDPGSVQQLCFIMLKALGYQDGADVSFATAVDDAVRLGLFSRREVDILQSDGFTRDAMMYMTYYSLFAEYKTGGRVIDNLIEIGQVSRADFERGVASVSRDRF
jgi:hypothetical protein